MPKLWPLLLQYVKLPFYHLKCFLQNTCILNGCVKWEITDLSDQLGLNYGAQEGWFVAHAPTSATGHPMLNALTPH